MLLLAMVLLAGPAATQIDGRESFARTIDEWTRQIESIRREVTTGRPVRVRLKVLDGQIDSILGKAKKSRAAGNVHAKEVRELVRSLGPAPKKDEQEDETLAAKRAALGKRLAAAVARVKQAELIIINGEKLLAQIAQRRRDWLARELGSRGPSLLVGATWKGGLRNLREIYGQVFAAPAVWWRSYRTLVARSSGALFVGILMVLAAATAGWLLRIWLLRRFGRDFSISNPTYARRVLAAVTEGVARGIVPALTAAAIWMALDFENFLDGLFAVLLGTLLVAFVIFVLVRAFARAALAPFHPDWRLTRFATGASRRLYRRLELLAGLLVVDLVLRWPSRTLQPNEAADALHFFAFDLLYAAAFLSLLRRNLWRSKAAPESEDPEQKDIKRQQSWSYALLCIVIGVAAVSIPIAALLDYHHLSRFIALRVLITGTFVALALLLHGLARELTVLAFESEGTAGQRVRQKLGISEQTGGIVRFWVLLLLDIPLIVFLGFALLPLWGLSWDDAFILLGRAFSGFSIGSYTFSLADFFLAVLIFIVLLVGVRLLQRVLEQRVLPHTRLDIGVRHALRAGVGYIGILLAALIAISTAGIDLSSLALIAGALSVGIGFGLQNIVGNFVSGLILLIERPIKVGDWVVIDGHEGFVKRISVRATEITTFQRASVIIPNSKLLENPLRNLTHKDASGRIDIPVGVAYGSNTQMVRDILLTVAKDHLRIKDAPPPEALFMDFGESSLDFQLRAHTSTVTDTFRIASELRFAIDQTFRENGIEIPFPQRDLHIRDLDTPMRIERAASAVRGGAVSRARNPKRAVAKKPRPK